MSSVSVPPKDPTPHNKKSTTRHGDLLHHELDDPIGRSLEIYGEWAQNEIDLLCQIMNPGDIVVDAGANVGTHTIAFAQRTGRSGAVIAIEPQPSVLSLLQENVRASKLENVTISPLALSNQIETLPLFVPHYGNRHNSGMASLVARSDTSPIQVSTQLLDDLKLTHCALIKMDIEGWEVRALEGAQQTIERCQPIIYVECNSIDTGWKLLQKLPSNYVAFLHAPEAFNAKNFRRSSTNIFGAAQETNLLLVPLAQLEKLNTILETTPHLDRIHSLDELSEAFVRANRYGEEGETNVRALALQRRLQKAQAELSQLRASITQNQNAATRTIHQLTSPLLVAVPVYNGFDDFQRLVRSLFKAYPTPQKNLSFAFINDASPDSRIENFLRHEEFQRTDVKVLTNPTNRGFIGTVNRALDLYCLIPEGGTDVVILNTDTLVFPGTFETLQDVAYRHPNVASVTPLSNNATIASLFNWPDGAEISAGLNPDTVADIVQRAAIRTPTIDVPTGIGFCMYMTQKAVMTVGGLDPIFGKGYGEENSWCQQASKAGFINLICTESFVYHRGSASFGNETKTAQLNQNMKILDQLHPGYHADVMSHLRADPLRDIRASLLWNIFRNQRKHRNLKTVLYLLHTDPQYFGGGTERHVQTLTQHLLSSPAYSVIHLFPDATHQGYLMRIYLPGGAKANHSEFMSVRFDKENIIELLSALASEIDILHVHHTLNWPHWWVHLATQFSHALKVATLHDYYAICPTIRLLPHGKYCDVPENLSTCNACLKSMPEFATIDIAKWRKQSVAGLAQFDRVMCPSESARTVLLKGIKTVKGRSLVKAPDIIACPNPLRGVDAICNSETIAAPIKPRVVFLGAYCEPKGGLIFDQACSEMQSRGWAPEIWGALGIPPRPQVEHRQYKNMSELRELAKQYPTSVVVMPALWPETFSFTTFEALVQMQAPVVVGPYGNPAQVVQQFGTGVVIEELTPAALIAGIERVLKERVKLLSRLREVEAYANSLTLPAYVAAAYAPTQQTSASRPEAQELPLVSNPEKTRIQHIEVSAPLALRHHFIDRANNYLKSRLPRVQGAGKWAALRLLK